MSVKWFLACSWVVLIFCYLARAQFCLLKWSPVRPNFVFGDQNLNLVASVTTSVIEVGDQKFWIIFDHRFDLSYRHIGSNFCAFTLSLATNFFLLRPLKFWTWPPDFWSWWPAGHQNENPTLRPDLYTWKSYQWLVTVWYQILVDYCSCVPIIKNLSKKTEQHINLRISVSPQVNYHRCSDRSDLIVDTRNAGVLLPFIT